MRRSSTPAWAVATTTIAVAVAVGLLAVAIGKCAVLDRFGYYPPGVCAHAPSVRFLVWAAALGAVIAGGAAILVLRSAERIRAMIGQAASDAASGIAQLRAVLRAEPRSHWIALLAVTAAGVALRLALLSQPIRYDEAYTQLFYVRQSLIGALSDYSHPNNHLLHTLLAKLATAALGDEPWALRIPALAAGLLVMPATYVAGRMLAGRTAAMVATALVAGSSEMVLYSTNARGYTMVVLAALCLIVFADWWRREMKPVAVVLAALSAGLGALAVPVMLYPIAATILWVGLQIVRGGSGIPTRTAVLSLLAFLCLTGAISAAGYSLVVLHMGWQSLLLGRDLWSVPEWSAVPGAIVTFVVQLASDWTAGMPVAVALMLLGLFVCGLPARARPTRATLPFAPILFATSLLLLAVLRAVPPTRGWLFALPVAAITVGSGVERVASLLTRAAVSPRAADLLTTATGLLLAVTVARSGAVLDSDATGTLRDGDAIARWLRARLDSGARIASVQPTGTVLEWHFRHLGMPLDGLAPPDDSTSRLYVIVNERYGQSLDAVLAAQRIDRTTFGSPRMLRPFAGASVYEMRSPRAMLPHP